MLAAMNANSDFVSKNGPASIVLTNGGGIRINIPAGDVTLGAAYTCLPFGNVLTVKQVKGSDLKAIIAFNADKYTSSGFGGFLQASAPSGLGLGVGLPSLGWLLRRLATGYVLET